MKEQILAQLDNMVEVLNKEFDIIIKKNKDGNVKIMYYKPKNLKKKQDQE